ncbi:hypothetical protein FOZ60_002132 [Perkinsus olseni]|uniref:Prolyl endopeptidase n=2 Tax=Perkinsus olseni TaxID=32597 RepID=A0A7J6P158_PEROL|nr:hypothetical protein FOZ60_002132 [Perkinsus olseni]
MSSSSAMKMRQVLNGALRSAGVVGPATRQAGAAAPGRHAGQIFHAPRPSAINPADDPWSFMQVADPTTSLPVQNIIDAENDLADEYFSDPKGLEYEKILYDEASDMLVPEGTSSPEEDKGYLYFQRMVGSDDSATSQEELDQDRLQFLRFCRVPASVAGAGAHAADEEVVLCTRELVRERGQGTYVEVVAVKLAPSNSLVGVVVDFTGDERFDLIFRHVPGGGPTHYPEIPLVRNFEWVDKVTYIPGKEMLYYTELDPETLRSWRVVRRTIDGSVHEVVFESTDPAEYVDVFKSKDGKVIFMSAVTKTTSRVCVISSDSEEGMPQPVKAPVSGVEYYCEHRWGYIYAVSNESNPDFAVYRASLADISNGVGEAAWEHFHTPDEMSITDIDMFDRCLMLYGWGMEGEPAVEAVHFEDTQCGTPDHVKKDKPTAFVPLVHLMQHRAKHHDPTDKVLDLREKPPQETVEDMFSKVISGAPDDASEKEAARKLADYEALKRRDPESTATEHVVEEALSETMEKAPTAAQLINTEVDLHPDVDDAFRFPFVGRFKVGAVELGVNGDFFAKSSRLIFSSPAIPGVALDYDMTEFKIKATKSREYQYKREPEMTVERVRVPSSDGSADILLTLASPAASVGQPAPTFVQVYGVYGTVLEAAWHPRTISLISRGWNVAWAHVRGGGERGAAWHQQAKSSSRHRSLTDFEDCLRWLVANDVTRPELLCATAASAGGLILAEHLNLWGDRWIGGAAILRVPFLDPLSCMLDDTLPLTQHEKEEWGDIVRDPDAMAAMKSYAPYHNIISNGGSSTRSVTYPPIFLSCAVDDSRVPYWAPLKWAERLRTATEAENLVVRIHKAGEGGHFGTTSAPQNYEETCREMSFMFRSLGLEVQPLKREKKHRQPEGE